MCEKEEKGEKIMKRKEEKPKERRGGEKEK